MHGFLNDGLSIIPELEFPIINSQFLSKLKYSNLGRLSINKSFVSLISLKESLISDEPESLFGDIQILKFTFF